MLNLTAKLPLSQKQKEQMAAKSIQAEWGMKWYELPIEERQNLREKRYASMFLGQSETPTAEDKAKAQAIVDSIADANASVEELIYSVTGIHPGAELHPSQSFIEASEQILATEGERADNEQNQQNKDWQKHPIAIANANSWDKVLGEQKAKVVEYIPAGDDDARFAHAKDILPEGKHETFALDIQLNNKQQLGADYADAGKCFVLTGPAGTGKTTGCREIAKRLLESGKVKTHDFKVKGGGGRWIGPSIAFVAYTNRASSNMRRALHKDPQLEEKLAGNITTIHHLLEYEPEFFDRPDGSTGMRFIPMRHAKNPLRITHLVIEESSMVGTDLWLKLFDALLPGTQIIFVGDINQLPPIFDKSVLNYALVTLPVVELTEVYRQALDSPIIANAHRCLRGESMVGDKDKFRIISGKNLKTIPSESRVVNEFINSLKLWHDTVQDDGQLKYDPSQDIILCPFKVENKDRGSQANTTVLNNHIAQFLGKKRNAMVWEVIAGMRKLYLAVGDRVMIDKQDGVITKIAHNANYIGKMPQPASTELTRFGIRLLSPDAISEIDGDFELAIEGYENLDVSKIQDEEEPKRAASHFVDVLMDSGRTVTLTAAGDFSESWFSLGYALTIHKAQGCEWRKVFIVLHRSHATMLTRELIYTAITRAREYCIIVDMCNMLDKAIANQKIKGNSVQEKIEWFNSEVSLEEPIPVIP